jgi:hypothetical protein
MNGRFTEATSPMVLCGIVACVRSGAGGRAVIKAWLFADLWRSKKALQASGEVLDQEMWRRQGLTPPGY